MQREAIISKINSDKSKKRISMLKKYKKAEAREKCAQPDFLAEKSSISIHTKYSFSPYYPSMAAYMAYRSGVKLAGICDHDSLSGASEFTSACNILGIESENGFETRVAMPAEHKDIFFNNVYQKGIAFIAVKGVPSQSVEAFEQKLAPLRAKRENRNRVMTDKLNKKMKKYGLSIDYERDIKPLSQYKNGGVTTERHIMFALAGKMMKKFVSPKEIISFLTGKFNVTLTKKAEGRLSDKDNPLYQYDLLDVIKPQLSFFYEPADKKEIPNAEEFIAFAHALGAIVVYSVSEDNSGGLNEGLEEYEPEKMFPILASLGFDGIEMNTQGVGHRRFARYNQLSRARDMLVLPSLDVNSPRNIIPVDLTSEDYAGLNENCWAVLGHEKTMHYNFEDGLFSKKTVDRCPSLEERIKLYSKIGRLTLR